MCISTADYYIMTISRMFQNDGLPRSGDKPSRLFSYSQETLLTNEELVEVSVSCAVPACNHNLQQSISSSKRGHKFATARVSRALQVCSRVRVQTWTKS
jgi:hypothetical protein